MHMQPSHLNPTRPNKAKVIAVAALAVAACTAGSPLHFKSKGDVWNVPVESSQDGGVVVTKVSINGKGPFYFGIRFNDTSTIHPELAKQLGLWETVNRGQRAIEDKTGDSVTSQLSYAQVDSLQIGELAVGRVQMIMLPNGGAFNGQPVLGVIGVNILSDTTIWHLDRDEGLFTIANQKHFEPPANAERIDLEVHLGELFTNVDIGGRDVYMRVRFDGPTTIRPGLASKLGLPPGIDGRWIADDPRVDGVQSPPLAFSPYREERRTQNPIEGELGAQFWTRYNLTINLHERAVWVTPRRAAPDPLTTVAPHD